MSGATRDGPRDPGAGGDRRVGGRFWALVESDEEEDADGGRHLDAGSPETASPTPSDHICEAFTSGYSEDEVALLVDDAIPQDDPARTGLDRDRSARRAPEDGGNGDPAMAWPSSKGTSSGPYVRWFSRFGMESCAQSPEEGPAAGANGGAAVR